MNQISARDLVNVEIAPDDRFLVSPIGVCVRYTYVSTVPSIIADAPFRRAGDIEDVHFDSYEQGGDVGSYKSPLRY